MTLRFRLLTAVLLGALAAFGHAPYDLPALLLIGMAAVVWLTHPVMRPLHAALVGWAFGTGYFMHALQWIVSPFMVDVARHGWMAPFALVFLGAGLALFWGLAFWGARLLSHRAWPLILTWSAVELLRAYIFTGFPWAMPAQALVGVIPGQSLSDVGPYVMNLWLIALAVGCGDMARRRKRGRKIAAGLATVLLALVVSLPIDKNPSTLTPHTIRLIQPNAPQRDKWNPDKFALFFQRQLEFTSAPPQQAGAAPDLVIWSETAIPWSLGNAGGALIEIAVAGGGARVAMGVQRRDGVQFYNSMVVLEGQGDVGQRYDKHHLVPFGEYMPLGDFLANFGIYGLAAREGHGYSAGPGAALLDFGPLGKALPLICYEAVFAHDVNAAPKRPDFLIQITNDAWFGKGAGPKQHLAQARMRAIEQGLPLARSANTGISAMIDPFGRVSASLPLNTAGFVDAPLPEPLPPTPYSRTGDLPFALLLLLGLGLATFRARRR